LSRDFLKLGYDTISNNVLIGRLDKKPSSLKNENNDENNNAQENEIEESVTNEIDEFDAYSYLKRKLSKFKDEDYPNDFKKIIQVKILHYFSFFFIVKINKTLKF
jgi:hypothetical protein